MIRLSSMPLVRPLGVREFGLLWSAQAISQLGDSIYLTALAWWVLEKTGSAAEMGKVLIFSFAPMLIFLLIGGVAVDRISRRNLMIASDVVRGLLVAVVAYLAINRLLEVWHVYVISITFGFVDAFFQPAYTAVMPELVPKELLPNANSLSSLSKQFSQVIGPIVAAGLVALGGTGVVFAINAGSFMISALLLIPLPLLKLDRGSTGARKTLFHDLGEGLTTVFKQPWLWITILISALVNLTLAGPRLTSLPLLVNQSFKGNVSLLGLFQSSVGVGSVVGALWLSRFAKIPRRGLFSYGAVIVAGFATAAMGLNLPVPLAVVAMFFMGAGVISFGLIYMNMLQELVARDQLGRVASIDMLGSLGLIPIGYGVAGALSDKFGAGEVFLFGGLLTVAIVCLGLLHPAIRTLD